MVNHVPSDDPIRSTALETEMRRGPSSFARVSRVQRDTLERDAVTRGAIRTRVVLCLARSREKRWESRPRFTAETAAYGRRQNARAHARKEDRRGESA